MWSHYYIIDWWLQYWKVFLLPLDSSIYEFHLSSRALTQAEEGAVRRSSNMEDLDSLLESLHSKILPGTVILFEIPSSSKIKLSKHIILGRYRTLFFGQTFEKSEFDPLVRDLVLIVREKMLGERAIKNLASSIQVHLSLFLILFSFA